MTNQIESDEAEEASVERRRTRRLTNQILNPEAKKRIAEEVEVDESNTESDEAEEASVEPEEEDSPEATEEPVEVDESIDKE